MLEDEKGETKLYQYATKMNENDLETTNPHIFKTVGICYQQFVQNKQNQTICIQGESGSGKTESTKLSIKFLIKNNHRNSQENIQANLEEQIISSSAILEAIGNAKTQRNKNSS